MCGILGKVSVFGMGQTGLDLATIKHRGPDGFGEWKSITGDVYLGHTRLAILEPTAAGQQPMCDSSGRFTITFNGEIYNHLLLRSLLPSTEWRGTSDTETLVELFASKGIECFSLLKGMFAFAIHDSLDNSVILVRDRLGIKPLWFRFRDSEYSFASEVRTLLKPGEGNITSNALSEYIGFGRLPVNGEVFNGIQSVSPGSYIKLSAKGYSCQHCWWPQDDTSGKANTQLYNHRDYARRVKKLVSTSIAEHLISDVGIGAFLSGGIDSSIVTIMAGKVLGKNLQTFTVGFPNETYDERAIARKVAKVAGSEHSELEIDEEACLEWVKEAVQSLDLPSVDAINTYIVSKAVRNTGLKVALSGLGGDELFGGYPSFNIVPIISWLNLFPPKVSSQLIKLMPERLGDKLYSIDRFSSTDLTVACRRFTPAAKLESLGLQKCLPVIPEAPHKLDLMGSISWAELHGYMIPMLLRDSDQMSMAVGLEIRVPFLDHQLVEEVLRIPQRFKKGAEVKSLLIEAFRNELPAEVYNRPKQGFALPMDEWLRGPLDSFMKEGVQAAADSLSLSEPLHQIQAFNNGTAHWTRVWLWSVLGHWLKKQETMGEYQPSN